MFAFEQASIHLAPGAAASPVRMYRGTDADQGAAGQLYVRFGVRPSGARGVA